MKYYDRYKLLRKDGKTLTVPFVKITERTTDKFIKFDTTSNRLDIVSDTYYGTPHFDWLILMANPQFGGLEFNIPSGTQIRIPYPLDGAIEDYETAIRNSI